MTSSRDSDSRLARRTWLSLATSAAVVISINSLAFGPSRAVAQVSADTSTPATNESNEVVIEGRKTTTQSVNPRATQTEDVITSKQLSLIPVTSDFVQALKYLPNVDVFEEGGNGLNGSDITINGFDETRINFTLDGVPLSDADSYSFYSNEFIQNLDIASITVDPGAGTATTIGPSAFGGSVAIESRDPETQAGAVAQGGAGSFGTFSEYGRLNSGQFLTDLAPTSVVLSYTHASSEGYFQDSGTDYKDSVMLKSLTKLGPGNLTLFFSQNQQQFHYYDGCLASAIASTGNSCNSTSTSPTSTYFDAYTINRYEDSLSYADYSLNLGNVKLDDKFFFYYGTGFGGGGAKGGSSDPAQYLGEILPERSWNNTNRPGDILTLTAPLTDALTLKLGGLFYDSHEEHYEAKYDPITFQEIDEPRVYDEFVISQLIEPYLDLQFQPVQSVIIDAGAKDLILNRKYTDNEDLVDDGSVHQHDALPSVGVNYEFVPGYHVYANYTENARPAGYNQFYTGVFNQDLSLEKADTEEVGFYVRSGPLEGRLSGFHTDYQNYILALQVLQPGTSSYISQVTNAGDAEYYGGSLALTYQIASWLSGFLNAGVNHTHLDAYGGAASNAPDQTVSVGGEAAIGGFSASLALEYLGVSWANYLDAFGSTNSFYYYELPTHLTLDASIGYKWADHPFGASAFKDIEAKLIFTNITNQVKADNATENDFSLANPYLYLTEPFSVFATLTVSL